MLIIEQFTMLVVHLPNDTHVLDGLVGKLFYALDLDPSSFQTEYRPEFPILDINTPCVIFYWRAIDGDQLDNLKQALDKLGLNYKHV